MKVHASDGEVLGKVVSTGDDTFLIEKGFFFPKDYYARYDQIVDVRDSEIWLSESGESLKAGLQAGTGSTEYRIPLTEEELAAEKRLKQTGEVRADEARKKEADIKTKGDVEED